MSILTPEEFSEALVNRKLKGSIYCKTTVENRIIPIGIQDQPAGGSQDAPLIIHFLGAIKPEKDRTPVMRGNALIGLNAIVLYIYDPSLEHNENLRIAWYQGDQELDVPAELSLLFKVLVDTLQPTRVIFSGFSGGGHAALYHSHAIPGSVCVVANPQVKISSYYERLVNEYRLLCWPDKLQPDQLLSSVIVDDLTRIYSDGYDNTVIYLQNSTDKKHIQDHMTLFLSNLTNFSNVMAICQFFPEKMGHYFRTSVWTEWMKASIQATSTSIDSIIDCLQDSDTEVALTPKKAVEVQIDRREIEVSEKIAKDAKEHLSGDL